MFSYASFEISFGQARLRKHAVRGQHICIAQLVIAGAKVTNLDLTLFSKPLQAVVHNAETNAERFGQLPLRELRVALKLPHDTKADIVVYLPAHEPDVPRLPHWRSQYESERKGSFIRERVIDSSGKEKAPCVDLPEI